jgi:hypothetical protein
VSCPIKLEEPANARWLKSCSVDGSVDQLRAAVLIALLNGGLRTEPRAHIAESAPTTASDAAAPDWLS